MDRLRLELQNTLALYKSTCEDLVYAKKKVTSFLLNALNMFKAGLQLEGFLVFGACFDVELGSGLKPIWTLISCPMGLATNQANCLM